MAFTPVEACQATQATSSSSIDSGGGSSGNKLISRQSRLCDGSHSLHLFPNTSAHLVPLS